MQRRYQRLVMSQVSRVDAVAAGVRALPGLGESFAAVQAAWRFYGNERVSLPQLAKPLLECVRTRIARECDNVVLVALDWSGLHFGDHTSKADRVELFHNADLGYELLTALTLSERSGLPLGPVALDLRAAGGVYSTRHRGTMPVVSQLDVLSPLMAHVSGLHLGRPAVFIIDREADSVGHYRQWDQDHRRFIVRANDAPRVMWEGQERPLKKVADTLAHRGILRRVRQFVYQGRQVRQYVGQSQVVIERAARPRHRKILGRELHETLPGPPLPLRLVVSEIRDMKGQVLACWLLLTNLPEAQASASTVALWYYWRWQIESYHKLLKGSGLHLEHWQQQSAGALARRLCVAAMAVTLVWQLAKAPESSAMQFRELLVRLSGRQIKRGVGQPRFTVPALLAGLGVLVPMLCLLEQYPLEQLRKLASQTLPFPLPHRTPPPSAP